MKVGLSLFVEHGPVAVKAFTSKGARVFLDLKLHDIPNTVELAAKAAGSLGVAYLTVHAGGGEHMVRGAVEGSKAGAAAAGVAPPVILAVTVLTSMDDPTLQSVGVEDPALLQVERLAALAAKAGAGGLVCSAREVSEVRRVVGPSLVLCTPGIRPKGVASRRSGARRDSGEHNAAGATLLVDQQAHHAGERSRGCREGPARRGRVRPLRRFALIILVSCGRSNLAADFIAAPSSSTIVSVDAGCFAKGQQPAPVSGNLAKGANRLPGISRVWRLRCPLPIPRPR